MRPAVIAAAAAICLPASAEIVAATSDHYTLRHEAVSSLSPEDMWERLLQPVAWWHPDHTYSGSADHLTLDPEAGGTWTENWGMNSVTHGTVLSIIEGESIRLDAPFGPLQGMAVNVVWTITIEPDGEGTRVIFDEIANGSSASALDQIAPAVDGVKQQAIDRLTMTSEEG
ncbi:SRPBCC domain-containing protein [Henriciella sp. AS95]|uniref:SRPBCC family protein n=1 Tax=Henriciella sp. AS95 TaxID=3135782 RepID=UPI0031788C6E